MIKRLQEAKELLLQEPDHQPDPILNKLFKKTENVTEPEENPSENGSDESIMISDDNEACDQNESVEESDLDHLELIDESAAKKICHFILKYDKKSSLAFALLESHQEILTEELILPSIEQGKILNHELLKQLDQPKCVKAVVEYLPKAETKPDWSILTSLTLDLEDCQIQACVASIIIRQGSNKDLKLGKFILSLLQNLPRHMPSRVLDLWSQVVSMHQSFLNKACQVELNKISLN